MSRVITDQELNELLEVENDQLGTSVYVSQLEQIIAKDLSDDELKNNGFNIGLYGSRGSGKSSIVNSVIKKFENNDDFKIVQFDCWKYSKDDLRRSIIIETCNVAGMNTKIEEINQKFYSSVIQKDTIKLFNKKDNQSRLEYLGCSKEISEDLKKIRKSSWLYICIIIIAFIISFIQSYLINDFRRTSTPLNNFILTNIALIITFLASLSTKLKSNLKIFWPISVTTHQLFSGEQFEKEFNSILENSYFKDKKILFVFDNIDRCDAEQVKEILMTIKTFLNHKNCIFLIPIDYDSVCRHYNAEDNSQGDEYLRKIFNLGIHIKKPHYQSLVNIVKNCITKNERENYFKDRITSNDINEISYVLSSVFAENPRKIKQFLNKLGAEILLQTDKSVTHLMKYLIIQQEIPMLFDYFLLHKPYINGILDYYKNYYGNYYKYKLDKNNTESNEKENHIVNLPIITENQFKILSELSSIQIESWSKLLEINNNNSEFKNQLLDIRPKGNKELFEFAKEKEGEQEIRSIIEENIIQLHGSDSHANKIIGLFIYYTVYFTFDSSLFDKLIIKGKIQGNQNAFNIEDGVFLQFVDKLTYKQINLINQELSEKITSKVVENNEIYKEFFKSITDIKIQKALLNDEVIDIEQFNPSSVSGKEGKVRILNNYGDLVPDLINRLIEKHIPNNIQGLQNQDISNLLEIVNNSNIVDSTTLTKIKNLINPTISNGTLSQYLNYYNQGGNHQISIDNLIKFLRIFLLNEKSDREWAINGLSQNIFNFNNGNNKFKETIFEIFKDDVNKRGPYNWLYHEFIITHMTNSNTTIDIISTMIKKTKDEKSIRKGLSDANIKSIINKIDYNDHSELIKNIWNNPISKDLLMGKLCELLPEDYIMKIEKIKNIGCKINEADKETITNNISDRLMKLLESGNIKDLAVVCDFVTGKENTGFINNKVKLKEGLKTYSMSDFKSTLKADEYECYNNKRKEAMKKLK